MEGTAPKTIADRKLAERLGARVARHRRLAAVSQQTLGISVGVSQRAISLWERGDRVPNALNLYALARHFNTTMEAFFEES